jgi:hypothetical protein
VESWISFAIYLTLSRFEAKLRSKEADLAEKEVKELVGCDGLIPTRKVQSKSSRIYHRAGMKTRED